MNTLIASIIVGLIAGWLAGVLYKGSGFGLVGNLIVGLIGAVVGGWVAGAFGIVADDLIGTVLVATGGAVLLLAIVNFFVKGRDIKEY
jgi:uncharacterized membrane protein YeaQ/YmgE (transglycosylase-associated protein family)